MGKLGNFALMIEECLGMILEALKVLETRLGMAQGGAPRPYSCGAAALL